VKIHEWSGKEHLDEKVPDSLPEIHALSQTRHETVDKFRSLNLKEKEFYKTNMTVCKCRSVFIELLPWYMRRRCGCSCHFRLSIAEGKGPVANRRKAQAVSDGLKET